MKLNNRVILRYKRLARKKNFGRVGFFLLLLLAISGCYTPTTAPQKKIFRMNMEDGLTTLDPAFARDQRTIWMTSQVFNGLVALDSNLQTIPAIARSWEITENGTVYTFYLRKDVLFHQHPIFGKDSTRKVVAEDVVYSLSRIINPKTASTGTWIFKNRLKAWKEVEQNPEKINTCILALNDSTVQIKLDKNFPPFLSLLAMPYCFIVPREVVSFYGKNFGQNPIGTGAFRFFQWKEGEALILHKNPNYFETNAGKKLPLIDGVKVQFIASRLTAFVSFLQGNLDFINGVNDTYKDEVLTQDGHIHPAHKDKIRYKFSPQLITFYIGIMTDSSKYQSPNHPLLYPDFRIALSQAIDRVKFVKYLLNNTGYPAENGLLPPAALGFDATAVKGNSYQPDSARKVIQKFLLKTDKNFEIVLNTTPQYAFIAQFLQKEWENTGIRVKTEIREGGSLRKSVYDGSLKIWLANWIGDYPDGETYLSLLYSGNYSPQGTNTTHYSNPRFDVLYEKATSEPLDSIRFRYYHEMENIMLQDQPLIPLYYGKIFRMTGKNIHNLGANPMNDLNLKYIDIRSF